MAPASVITRELRVPDSVEAEAAQDVVELLSGSGYARIRVVGPRTGGGPDLDEVELPPYIIDFVAGVLGEVAQGNAVTVGGVVPELTTQQAADLLRVSRPYLVKLIDDGVLPHRRVGNRRKILLDDVLDYKRRDEADRRRVLDELTREAEDLGIDY
ncbi:MAG: helix-turn-helix domain-containing protein [Chloroflexota bacterium]